VKRIITPFRVGLLVIVAGTVLFAFLTFVKKGGMKEDEGITVHAYFRDASGLGKKSRVQIAGIPVGEIIDIRLENIRARITLRIRRDVGLREDAALSKRSESLLGDYMLDLSAGSLLAPAMVEGGEIKRVVDAQGMEQVFGSLSVITADIQAVTASLKNVLGGEKGQGSMETIVANMVKLTDSVDGVVRGSAERLDNILRDVESISGDVRRVTAGEQGSIHTIVENIDVISHDVRDVIASVKRVVGQNEGEVAGQVSSIKDTLARLDRTLANLEEVSKTVREGKGAVGALVANERLGQRLSETVEDVADYASKLTNLELEVGIRSEYLFNQASAKNTLQMRLVPKPDKYYLLEAVDDPRGSVETVYVQQNPPTAGAPAIQKQTITKDSIKFSAQFAKRYSFLTLRFGIIESTGGVGIDLNVPLRFFYYSRWLEDALVLKVDAFNFSVESLTYPRLRAAVRFTPFEHVYVTAGMDDILNVQNRDTLTNRLISGRDFFLGGGIYFTDADLKSILPIIPKP
jgi:phospholipid/cholesterol/gamma-HCH transport system substrate-binding protein